jgi:hypothetical protein
LPAPVLNDVPARELHELRAEVVSEFLAMPHGGKAIEFSGDDRDAL